MDTDLIIALLWITQLSPLQSQDLDFNVFLEIDNSLLFIIIVLRSIYLMNLSANILC